MSTKDMKRNPETKSGSGPAANVFFNPERDFGTSEQKEKIKQASQ
ncbi:MAG: hypothetical protein AB1351_07735 [Thermoproteota archaeon]